LLCSIHPARDEPWNGANVSADLHTKFVNHSGQLTPQKHNGSVQSQAAQGIIKLQAAINYAL